ncbi:MAG: response regulator [Planctomycetia bacterium]|nr:response regulator [Planctomycetia bacterium]
MKAQKPTILVVDDDRDTCQNLCDILIDLGYAVQTAGDGLAALELVRKHPIDLALLDFKMPGMDGLSLYREIKRISPATVAIIISAYVTPATTAEACRAGTWKVLAKPVDLGAVLPLVEEALSWPVVLLVDDDRDLCASLWDVLHERGYRTSLAHSVPIGTQLLLQRKFDVVLLDLKLPEGTAKDVMAVMRMANPDARTILITGHRAELESLIAETLADGADAVCYKPFDLDRLLGTLGKLTARGQRAAQAASGGNDG